MFGWKSKHYGLQANVARQPGREREVTARRLDRTVGKVRRGIPVAIPVKPERTQVSAQHNENADVTGEGTEVLAYTITGENNSTWSTAQGVQVAKPVHLRGATQTRTVNGENQVQLPAVTPGEVMIAAKLASGVAGVEWIDLNMIGRAWAEDI